MTANIKKQYYVLFFAYMVTLPSILHTMEQDTPDKTKSEIKVPAPDTLAQLPKEIVQVILSFVIEGNTMAEAYNSIGSFLVTNKRNSLLFDDAFSKYLVDILYQQFMPQDVSSYKKQDDMLTFLDNGTGLINSLKTSYAKQYAQDRLEQWMANNADTLLNNANALLIAAIKNNRLATVKFLIEKAGADINFRPPHSFGYTPLILAVHKNNPAIVAYLLKAGADKTLTEQQGKTALNIANDKNYTKIAQQLLEEQSDTHFKEEEYEDAFKKRDI